MKIGLIDVDGHAKKKKFGATIYPNLALCKIAGFHKAQRDEVVWYDPMYTGHCDKVYISKVFNLSLARDLNVKHILKHKQMSNKKPITGSVKEFKPLTAEERQEQAVRMYVQKRESIATGVLFNLMHNPELLKDDEYTPEGIADAAIKIADKMIEKLYFDKGE